ncbi:MAG: CBS domain-containing protein [Candidatus Omnitrophica bacterium]|nr:CBS domain-containing protein [Candidatus Omnitrophota bacterium]
MDIETVLKEERLRDLELKAAVTVGPDLALTETIAKMQHAHTGCAVVLAQGKVLGIFTERDLVLKVLAKGVDLARPVGEWMTPDPHVLHPHDSVAKAIEVINTYGHRSIPLVDEKGEFAGLVSVRAIITFLAEHFPTEVFNLPPRPEILDDTAEGG